jgi:hypothetical protein
MRPCIFVDNGYDLRMAKTKQLPKEDVVKIEASDKIEESAKERRRTEEDIEVAAGLSRELFLHDLSW